MSFTIENGVLKEYKGKDKTVVIPDGVTAIGERAFGFHRFIEKIIIPSSVTTIVRGVFKDCSSLKEINIPDGVTEIGKYAFEGCESLQDEQGFVIVNNILFDYYGEETNVVIPEGITKISNSSFRKCKTIKNITTPNSVTTIASSAFWSCRSLENIAISDSVTEIEEDAFYDCKKLKSMIIPVNTNLQSKKKYQPQIFKNISDELNKYINQITNVLFYLDEEIEYDGLKYKVDIPNYPRININGYENISISNEDIKNILSLLQEKCAEDERWYIPLAVFADDDTAKKLINDFDIWSKGKKKDKKRLMRVKGALLLNDTYTAYQYFEKIDKLKLYANKRNLTVYKLKKQLTKNNLGV